MDSLSENELISESSDRTKEKINELSEFNSVLEVNGFKCKEIKLFGRKLLISERPTKDVLDLVDYVNNSTISNNVNLTTINLLTLAYVVHSGLKINYINKNKFFNFKYKKLKKLLSLSNLIHSLSIQKLSELAKEIYILEGQKVDDNDVNIKTEQELNNSDNKKKDLAEV